MPDSGSSAAAASHVGRHRTPGPALVAVTFAACLLRNNIDPAAKKLDQIRSSGGSSAVADAVASHVGQHRRLGAALAVAFAAFLQNSRPDSSCSLRNTLDLPRDSHIRPEIAKMKVAIELQNRRRLHRKREVRQSHVPLEICYW